MDTRSLIRTRSREITRQIHDVLWQDWDPLGVQKDGPEDEYDAYIGPIYRLLVSGASGAELIRHLQDIEDRELGIAPTDTAKLEKLADKLLKLDVTLETFSQKRRWRPSVRKTDI